MVAKYAPNHLQPVCLVIAKYAPNHLQPVCLVVAKCAPNHLQPVYDWWLPNTQQPATSMIDTC